VRLSNSAPSPYGAARLRREGDYWALELDGRVCRVRHGKGLSFLAELLAHPGGSISAYELDRLVERGRHPAGVEGDAEEPGAAERARLNVTRSVRLLLRKIALYHPSAGAHLAASIKTGKSCSYAPDPKLAIDWTVSTELATPVRHAGPTSAEGGESDDQIETVRGDARGGFGGRRPAGRGAD
jgi:hypothetical protein